MKLLTKEVLERLPVLGATEKLSIDDHVLQVKFFDPYGSWTWYACEYDPKEGMFFGYVQGLENEWGYFSYKELTSLNFYGKPRIERDLYFKPITYGEFCKRNKH